MTREDRQIAVWMADGCGAELIAEWLRISLRTAKYRIAAVRQIIHAETGQQLCVIKAEPQRRIFNLSDTFFRAN